MADRIEAAQLSMADELLGHAEDLLADRRSTSAQVHYLACRLAESLRDVRRVAESRGRQVCAGSEAARPRKDVVGHKEKDPPR